MDKLLKSIWPLFSEEYPYNTVPCFIRLVADLPDCTQAKYINLLVNEDRVVLQVRFVKFRLKVIYVND